jgi:hypothetical protein
MNDDRFFYSNHEPCYYYLSTFSSYLPLPFIDTLGADVGFDEIPLRCTRRYKGLCSIWEKFGFFAPFISALAGSGYKKRWFGWHVCRINWLYNQDNFGAAPNA